MSGQRWILPDLWGWQTIHTHLQIHNNQADHTPYKITTFRRKINVKSFKLFTIPGKAAYFGSAMFLI